VPQVPGTAPGIGRNDPCPCGSGRRFKACHGAIGAAAAAGLVELSADSLATDGVAAHQRGDLAGAEQCYRAALARVPDHPVALHYLGVIHYQHDDLGRALGLLERAAAMRPEEPEFHNNLGLALARAERDDEAIARFERALALRPDHAGAFNNLGLSLRALNRVDDAIAAYRRALTLQPGFGEARWNLALALLARGDFAEGWREYDTRLALGVFQAGVPSVAGPRWEGGDPSGKTLLLTAEQGLGDAIQFVRLAKSLADRGARVVVRAPEPLVALFRTAPGVSQAIGPLDPLPPFDARLPILSLPAHLAIDGANVPAVVPYLQADESLRLRARGELARLSAGLRVGIAWQGSRQYADDRRRSTTLATLAPLLSVPGIRWISLQKGDDGDSQESSALARLDARQTMEGTAALVAELDLVVSVDTSVAHLAGALGRTTWLLVPFASDWRWGIAGDRTPWYPQTRLFRQPSPGNWPAVVGEVRGELERLAAASGSR
jgi:Tfp pilus assembly protein PilF